MDVREALQEQYHASLGMLRQCVEKCPSTLWEEGTFPRAFWRIAFHTVYFTHLYLGQNEAAFQPWPGRRNEYPGMWQPPWDLEPYELPEETEVYSPEQILDYIAFVVALIDPVVDTLDLDSPDSGFSWYKNNCKLSHQILNIRHIQGHVGQLSELLMMREIDIKWVSGRQDD